MVRATLLIRSTPLPVSMPASTALVSSPIALGSDRLAIEIRP